MKQAEEKGTSYGSEGISNDTEPKSLRNKHTYMAADLVTSHSDKMFMSIWSQTLIRVLHNNAGFREQRGYSCCGC